jgi:hydroxyethylthiazole kinase-like uncharacterized protein yjeF
VYLVTSEQMQALDRRTITTRRIPGILLMEHAGKQVAEVVMKQHPKRVTVLCGKGNNGGDGWIAARWLRHFGVPFVHVVTTVEPNALSGDAKQAADMALAADVPYEVYASGGSIPPADVYVDALLGTGVTRPVTGVLAELMERVNAVSPWTVAVDVPSGVDASTGRVDGAAVRAHVTVAMGYQKLGTAVTPGCLLAGAVEVVDIGIEPADANMCAAWVTPDAVRIAFPRRSSDTHKGTYGRVGIAVGSMHGAAILAGLGAARAGAGLVILGGRDIPNGAPYEFVLRKATSPTALFDDCDSIVVGPGLGPDRSDWQSVMTSHKGPGVLDADGLALMQDVPRLNGDWVLTPHPKECGRLLQWSTAEVQANRIRAAQTLAEQTKAVVVLKGYRSLVAHPDGRLRVVPTGDASLATAGTGDVLAGVIGGLQAQGVPSFDAACAGAYIHGLAGELAGQHLGKASTMATDVVENISRAISLHFDADPEESL